MAVEYVPIGGAVDAIMTIRKAVQGGISIPIEPCATINCPYLDKTGSTVCKYEDGLVSVECPRQKGRLSIKIASLDGEDTSEKAIKAVCLEPVENYSPKRRRISRRSYRPFFLT